MIETVTIPLFGNRFRMMAPLVLGIAYMSGIYYLLTSRNEPVIENVVPISLLFPLLLYVVMGKTVVRRDDKQIFIRCLVFFRYRLCLDELVSAGSVEVKKYRGMGIGLRWLPGMRLFVPAYGKDGICLEYKNLKYLIFGSEEQIAGVRKLLTSPEQ